VEVGKSVSVSLDSHDPKKGSAPGASSEHDDLMRELNTKYPRTKFIRGHLLNDNLGGLGMWWNMFPISSEANAAHLNSVERPVKRQLLNAHKENEKLKGEGKGPSHGDWVYVDYTVSAHADAAGDFLNHPDASFWCSWSAHRNNWFGGSPLWGDRFGFKVIKSHGGQTLGQNDDLDDIGWGSSGSGKRKGVSVRDGRLIIDGEDVGRVSDYEE
jgi:hypothetical protein